MSRPTGVLAAAAVVLAAATGCGPAGALAPGQTETQPAPTDPAATAPGATPGPSTPSTATPPLPAAEPPPGPGVPSPPVVPLPALPPAPPRELPVQGPAPARGERYDLAMVCEPPLTVSLDTTGEFDALADPPDGPSFWCADGNALVALFGVDGDRARAWASLDVDLAAPLIVRVPAGSGFGADAVARLTAQAPGGAVQVMADCPFPGELFLGDRALACPPGFASATFDGAVPLAQGLLDLRVPEGYRGTVTFAPLP